MADRSHDFASLEGPTGINLLPRTGVDSAFFDGGGRSAVTLASLLAIVWRRRLAFSAAFLVTFGLATLVVLSLQPRYESTALLMVDPRQTNITKEQSIQDSTVTLSDLNFVRSEMQVLTSDGLATNVVKTMQLQDDPEFAPHPSRVSALLATALSAVGLTQPAPAMPGRRVGEAVAQYLQRFNAYTDGKSFVIGATFSAADPALAQRVLEQHLAVFAAGQIAQKRKVIAAAEDWFAEELQTLHAKLVAEEARQQAFRQSSQLILATGATVPERQLTTITNQLSEARADLNGKEARYRELVGSGNVRGNVDSTMLSSELVQRLGEQEAAAAQVVAKMEQQYGGYVNYPPLVGAKAALASVQTRIAAEVQRLTASAASDVAIARQRTHDLETELADANRRLVAISNDALTAAQLDRDIEADRHLYDDLLLRSKQVSIQGQLQEPDLVVISAPTLPLQPAFPRRGILLIIAAMAAATVGALAALASDMLRAVKATSLQGIEAACGVPGLGTIPWLRAADRRRIDAPNPGGLLAGALQTLRNSVAFRSADRKPKVTVFVSALPGEGKTLLATLYARSLAGASCRVLLIDGDLRRLAITKATATAKAASGLAGYLAGKPLEQCVAPGGVANLDILPSGSIGADPAEMLTSEHVGTLFAASVKQYDAVVVDTPPVAIVDDALHLVAQADATILIARWNRTPMAAIQHALHRLRLTGGTVIGVALSGVDMKKYRSGSDAFSGSAYRKGYYITET